MGRQTRRVPKDRMSQARLDALIVQPVQIDREHVDPKPVLTSDAEYDSMHPEETIKEFCIKIRDMLRQYEYDKDRYNHLEQEMQDLLHFIEMGTDKNANIGFKLYKRMMEIRRERRICKNEMDLLQPVYDTYSNGDKLNELSQLQGLCRVTGQAIRGRAYTVRTDVLKEFI